MLYELLSATGLQRPSATAVVSSDGARLTYAELTAAVDAFAARLLADRVAATDRVVLLLPNRADFVVGMFAVAKLGAVAVSLNPAFQEAELAYYFRDAQPVAVLTTPQLADRCAGLARHLDRPCHILTTTIGAPSSVGSGATAPRPAVTGDVLYQYSSGSTGVPKRVIRTQANLVAEADSFFATVGVRPEDRILTAVPLYHAHGFGNCLLAAVRAGATLVLHDGFQRPRVMEALRAGEVSIFPGVPFMFGILAASSSIRGERLPALRLCFSAGAPLTEETFTAFREKFDVEIRQLYGSTETGAVTFNLGACDGERWASAGKPLAGVELRIADGAGRTLPPTETGEILVRSAAATRGYGNLPDLNPETFRDGCYWSGDLGRVDADGNLFVTGRKKLFIDTGGYKVDPVEVEQILNGHPKVTESVVLGIKAQHGRELVKAVIVSREPVTTEEMWEWCRGKIADFKIPRLIEFRDEIPKSPLGKILRKYLQDAP